MINILFKANYTFEVESKGYHGETLFKDKIFIEQMGRRTKNEYQLWKKKVESLVSA